ncbi:MAG: ribbon-helix-helix protein, CopG family [Acidobacteria bacterium]|nr:ribbon-helix-helix protein, CopG family [Acidobacteriota bacterium]
MKTTLIIHDTVMERLKERAAKTGCTISELVEDALRLFLKEKPKTNHLPPLPTLNLGPFLVDITDREALYAALEDDGDDEKKP